LKAGRINLKTYYKCPKCNSSFFTHKEVFAISVIKKSPIELKEEYPLYIETRCASCNEYVKKELKNK